MVKVAWATDDPATGGVVFGVEPLGADEGCAEEDQEWEVGGEGVVLLVGGEGEEDEDEGGEESQEEGGALRKGVDVEERSAGGRVDLAAAKALEQEQGNCDQDGEEVGDVGGIAQGEADDDYREGLPVGDLVWLKGIALVVTAKAE